MANSFEEVKGSKAGAIYTEDPLNMSTGSGAFLSPPVDGLSNPPYRFSTKHAPNLFFRLIYKLLGINNEQLYPPTFGRNNKT